MLTAMPVRKTVMRAAQHSTAQHSTAQWLAFVLPGLGALGLILGVPPPKSSGKKFVDVAEVY